MYDPERERQDKLHLEQQRKAEEERARLAKEMAAKAAWMAQQQKSGK